MTLPAPVETALDGQSVRLRWLIIADFVGDPVYWTSAPYDRTFGASETGDAYLDGKTFKASTRPADPQEPLILGIGDIDQGSGGGDTLTLTLSGLLLGDNDLLNLVGDRTKWADRLLLVYWYIEDSDGSIIADIPELYHKGRFVAVDDATDPSGSKIVVSSEPYLSVLTGSSGRRWDQQKNHDAADTSPGATVAAVNGTHQNVVSGAIVLPGLGGIGGFRGFGLGNSFF